MKVRLRPALRRRTTPWLWLAIAIAGSELACKRSRAPEENESEVPAEAAAASAPRATTNPDAPVVHGGIPAGLANPIPLKAEVVTRKTLGKSTVTRTRSFTRGKDRVHVVEILSGGKTPASEWLFVQSPDDVRRVTGALVDHEIRAIIVHQEHELAGSGGSRHWAEVATLGLKTSEAFETLQPTGKRQQAFGFDFSELAPRPGYMEGFRELWWSERAAVPLRWVVDDARGRTEFTATFSTNVDMALLRDPHERFPAYEVTDLEKLAPEPTELPEPAADAALAPSAEAAPAPATHSTGTAEPAPAPATGAAEEHAH